MISSSSSGGGLNGSNGSNNNSTNACNNEKDKIWYFTSDQLSNSPSRRTGIKPDQELSYRQLTAYLIQEMGQRLQVSQLCINTAIVYMHRFYAFHSFSHFHRNSIAAASLFLAAKVEEQPRKLEHVIKAANKCLPQAAEINYADQAQDLVFNENVLLQTLGFDVAIDHPHTHVVKTCHLVKACKDLAQTSYFLASNSLHLTSMCLQYRPTVVACFCIYLACKWSRWEIPQSTEGKHWFYYVDKTVTLDLLKKLTEEFIGIYEKSPTRLQSKLNSIKAIAQGASNRGKDKVREDFKMGDIMKGYHSSINTDSNSNGAFSLCDMPPQTAPALLPPPTQLPPQQQMRKVTEMHSSQHRSSSASSASHHHSKQSYSNTGDANSDHKSKQQSSGYGSNAVSRPPSSNHQSMSLSSGSQRSGLSSNSGRPSSSSSGISSQRPPPPQMHPMDYHKSTSSRDRNGMNLMPGAHGAVPSHGAHKMPLKQQQQDVNRSSAKDITRMPEPLPPKQSSSKLYPGGPPSYGSSNNQLPQSNKVDDPTRNIMHGQRGYMPGGSSSSSSNNNSSSSSNVGQSSNSGNSYHHHHQRPPSSLASSGNSSTISNSKSSVHGLPHTQYDQLPPPYGSQTTHQPGSLTSGYTSSMRNASESNQTQSLSDEHNSLMPPTQVAGSSAAASLFSPDLKDKQQQQPHLNGLSAHIQQHDALSFKPSAGSNRDKNSPKKDRSTTSSSSSGTPTKRDKNRIFTSTTSSSSSSSTSMISTATNLSALAGMRNDPTIPVTQARMGMSVVRKPENSLPTTLSDLGSVGGTGANHQSSISSLKRLSDGSSYAKHDEDSLMRDNKIRKIDNTSSSLSSGPSTVGGGGLSSFTFSGSTETAAHDKIPITMVNGMETTPDLVRSLINEVCTPNVLMKSEPLTMPGLKPPAELLDPSSGQSTLTSSSTSSFIKTFGGTTTINANDLMSATASSGADAQNFEQSDDKPDKSEKKKKKDKHKHKEKDKSKDREERKKHKKDKDKHKDRDRDNDSLEHVKLVIPKDKLESGGGGGDLKIKIAKDRFKADIGNTSSGSSSNSSTMSAPQLATTTTAGLKIKISKDILDSYNSSGGGGNTNSSSAYSSVQQQPSALMGHNQHNASGGNATNLGAAMNPFSGINMTMTNSVSGGGGGGAGGLNVGSVSNTNPNKRKDRDRERERDKDKKRNAHDFLKYNGSANLMPSNIGVGGIGFPISAVTSSAASLMHMTSSSLVTTANNAALSMSSAYGKK